MSGFEAQFRAYAALTEKHLEDSIGVLKNSKDYALPVVNAMRYSLLSGASACGRRCCWPPIPSCRRIRKLRCHLRRGWR